MNYAITKLIHNTLLYGLDTTQGRPRYAEYNAAIGALECAKQELYCRRVGPYEDMMRGRNGDVT